MASTHLSCMGFFYAMNFKTKTRIEGNEVVIDLYKNGEFLTEYYFYVEEFDHYIEHISGKYWGTPENINEIKSALWTQQVNS